MLGLGFGFGFGSGFGVLCKARVHTHKSPDSSVGDNPNLCQHNLGKLAPSFECQTQKLQHCVSDNMAGDTILFTVIMSRLRHVRYMMCAFQLALVRAVTCSARWLHLQDVMVESNKELHRRGQQTAAHLDELMKAIGKQNSAVLSRQ